MLRQWEEYGRQHPVQPPAPTVQPSTEVPEGTVHEEGLLASAWSWWSTKREAAKIWVRDHTGALGKKLFSPSSNTAREQEIQQAFQGRPEADAAADYNQKRKVGEGVRQISGDVAAAGGEIATEAAIQYVEGHVAGMAIGGVIQSAGRARQALRNAAKGSEKAVELEVQAGRRAAAAEDGVARRTDEALAVGGGSAPSRAAASDASYVVDDAGLTVRAEGRVTGPHRGRGKGHRPDPAGGRVPGEHRGHLIPEGGVDQPDLVNVRENIISETAASNLGPKRALDNLVSRIATENPNSVVRIIAEPLRRPNEMRPFAVTYWVEKDGVRITGQTILNR